MDIKDLDDDQLDDHRRDVLIEQERRQKLADGLDLIGHTVRDYLVAAERDVPNLDDTELGQKVVDLL